MILVIYYKEKSYKHLPSVEREIGEDIHICIIFMRER